MKRQEQEKVFKQMGQQGNIIKTPNVMVEELYRNLPKALMILNQNQYIESVKGEQRDETTLVGLKLMKRVEKLLHRLAVKSGFEDLPELTTLQQDFEEVMAEKKAFQEEMKKQKEAGQNDDDKKEVENGGDEISKV